MSFARQRLVLRMLNIFPSKEDAMSSRYWLRTALILVLCLAITRPASGQSCRGPQGQVTPCVGSSTGAVILIVTGLAATAALIYALRHHPQKDQKLAQGSVVGCVEKNDEGTFLKNEKDHLTYGIVADTVHLKNGERVELSGRKYKDRYGKLNVDVDTLVQDYGPCTP